MTELWYHGFTCKRCGRSNISFSVEGAKRRLCPVCLDDAERLMCLDAYPIIAKPPYKRAPAPKRDRYTAIYYGLRGALPSALTMRRRIT